jgi:recombination protein RecA
VDTSVLAIAARINKKLGEGTIILGSEIEQELVPRAPSGSLAVDIALGGGWPLNRWIEVIGYESAGKTLLALKTIASNQARDKNWTAVWFDAEQCWDKRWARTLGVDDSRVLVMKDNGMESVYGSCIEFLDSKKVDCIVIDSLPALVPEREDENQMGEITVGLGALLTGQFFRKQQPASKRSMTANERPVLGLMINQWRDRIGVIRGDPRTTPGGRGKNFFYSIRVEVKRDDWIEEGDLRVGQTIKMTTIKNKTAPPQRSAVVDFYFCDTDDGGFKAGEFDRVKEIVAIGKAHQLIHRGDSGKSSWYEYGDEKWRGVDALVTALRGRPDLYSQLEAEVRQLLFHHEPPPVKRRVRRASK